MFKRRRSAYERIGSRHAFCRALVSAALVIEPTDVRVVLGGLAPRPFEATHTSAALMRDTDVAHALTRDCDEREIRGDAPDLYRLAEVLVRRAHARATLRRALRGTI